MKVLQALKNIKSIQFSTDTLPVVQTAALELKKQINSDVEVKAVDVAGAGPGVFQIVVGSPGFLDTAVAGDKENFIYLRIGKDSSGLLIASKPYFLFSFVSHMVDDLADENTDEYEDGMKVIPSFSWRRISYDYFLTQEGRVQDGLDRETYVKQMARLGFTHIEVNGLASPMGLETGPKGETYPMFYTYCPALDQFVYSKLNKGVYPFYYLSANLGYLKENVALAEKYGLTPGLLCFEPRSVPEDFFTRYPMLRGARVDHPYRSFKPRYNMTITHPAVLDHYAEMVDNLMVEAPKIGFINIWTNDSGAGFEHTKSLYVGRNGGPYLIREWKDDEQIARLAGKNAVRFLNVLKEAGRARNPEFRVITRMESFYGEHDTVWEGLGDNLDVETASLTARGWDMTYTHPSYPDSTAINGGSVYQAGFDEEEKPPMKDLAQRGGSAHFYFTAGPHIVFEPLLGTPYPFLTYDRLKLLKDGGVKYLAHQGGGCPPELAPFDINHEVCRQFQFDSNMDIESVVSRIAVRWAGQDLSSKLVEAWKLAGEAILAFPNVTPLYTGFGFTWYRLWARPLVPDIEKIPSKQRAYYEDFMCTTPHNPNNVDLSRDVLFELTNLEKSRLDVERIDENLFSPMDEAIGILELLEKAAQDELGEKNVIHDQAVRMRALKCWFMTNRSVAAWIAGVHGYLIADNEEEKKACKALLKDMTQREIENTLALKQLLDGDVEIISTSSSGETPLIHGKNLSKLLDKKIELMQKHENDEPYIDPDYIERKSGNPI